MDTTTKTCRTCEETKPLTDFPARKDSPDGRRNECKQCFKKRQQKWQREHRKHLAKYQRNYRKKQKAASRKTT